MADDWFAEMGPLLKQMEQDVIASINRGLEVQERLFNPRRFHYNPYPRIVFWPRLERLEQWWKWRRPRTAAQLLERLDAAKDIVLCGESDCDCGY